jgi:TetR/AcrR family transcriptional regulator, ethionamide resistance regulator
MSDDKSDVLSTIQGMPILSRRDERGTARQAALERNLLAATEELLEEGAAYADVSIEQITTRAGVSRTVFYGCFRDKRDLLMRAAREMTDPLVTRAEEFVDRQVDADEALEQIARETLAVALRSAREHAPLFRAVTEASTYDKAVAEYLRGVMNRLIGPVARRFEKQQRAGRALPLAPLAGASVLVGMVLQALHAQVTRDTGISDEQLVETLATVWLRAVYGLQPGQAG